MKKCTNNLPVSRKAYHSFIDRINAIVRKSQQRRMMLDALDRYLRGDSSDYNSDLDTTSAMAFEFLRVDIDAAIRRSAAARSRASMRKQKEDRLVTAMAAAFASYGHVPVNKQKTKAYKNEEDEQQPQAQPLPIPRAMRRADERAKRPKTKWRKIG